VKRFLILPVALAAVIALGCDNTSPTGGGRSTTSSTGGNSRGTTPPADRSGDAGRVDKSTTFSVKGPALATGVKQGEKKNIDLTIDRGSNFKDAVKLAAEAPMGLKVEIAKANVAAGDDPKVVMSVEADKDAPLAEHVGKVTATPTAGTPTSLDVKVKVEQAK
jgi:hypothetical protein